MTPYKNFLLVIVILAAGIAKGQVVDIPPNGKQNYRAQTGGSVPVNINNSISLDSLIKRLGDNWELKETGKAYWIGYTDDMYSIASYQDSAIRPLLNYYTTTKSVSGKAGVIYCLHLIGIESKIAGRFIEHFVNKNAREALLNLASDTNYLSGIVTLLARDPWKSDLPTLGKLLKENSNLELINALFRYTYEDFPFRQNIPENLDTIGIYLEDTDNIFHIGHLETIFREGKWDFPDKGNKMNRMNDVVIQRSMSTGRIFRKLKIDLSEIKKTESCFNCDSSQLVSSKCEILNRLLYDLIMVSNDKVDVFSYCGSDDKFSHYVTQNNIFICIPEITRKRWLNYLKSKKLIE